MQTSEVKTAAAPAKKEMIAVKVEAPKPKPAPKAHNLLSTKATN
jgi:hypothetical protein